MKYWLVTLLSNIAYYHNHNMYPALVRLNKNNEKTYYCQKSKHTGTKSTKSFSFEFGIRCFRWRTLDVQDWKRTRFANLLCTNSFPPLSKYCFEILKVFGRNRITIPEYRLRKAHTFWIGFRSGDFAGPVDDFYTFLLKPVLHQMWTVNSCVVPHELNSWRIFSKKGTRWSARRSR